MNPFSAWAPVRAAIARRAARAETVSCWSPSTSWMASIRAAPRRAGLPRIGSAASKAYRERFAALRIWCSPRSRVDTSASSLRRIDRSAFFTLRAAFWTRVSSFARGGVSDLRLGPLGEQPTKHPERVEIGVAFQETIDGLLRLGALDAEVVADSVVDRAELLLRGHAGEGLEQRRGQHLVVPEPSQTGAQRLQRVAQGLGPGGVEHGPKGRERGADPADRDSQIVDRVDLPSA